ncbi:hypothetical protein CBF34_01695 [Vagococcus penaei]|uniref:Octanoyl-[GcvH]:protein N-octanoyltransferase n=1 Tax=Vagococcus penaei TaxID=633807 RepID=A0A1Q2D7L6_9ENTE|nr:lipoate--protein ligase family protein [Vagococcus penaei]AQP54347.1 hypothetical protein BW732_09005 [Vagococcus penaei]RSU06263.1 hypothetical protein CBF34_01695 [Vagococcus penaei]
MTQIGTLFDQGQLTNLERFDPFIYTDLLTTYVGETNQLIFHFWQMTNQVILGMKDTRVPNLTRGIQKIATHGYFPVVRNSGGLAVVADEGVLNFSIIIPENFQQSKQSIDDGYLLMKQLITTALNDFDISVDAHEVSDSYCPGDFDLSIDGKKFAGIAQRRVKKGIAIMIYLSVYGNQQQRGQLVRDFYLVSLENNFGTDGYPPVSPESMANLSDLLGIDLTIADIKNRIKGALPLVFKTLELVSDDLQDYLTNPNWKINYEQQYKRMAQRNHIIQSQEE